jgi:two-component system invasion response regulator UvrY
MKVLLIDDHWVVREGVRRLLSALPGVELTEAEDAAGGFDAFRLQPPDVVLLDLNLKGVGGVELLRRLLNENPRARIIVFTMHADALTAARALRMGARGYVSKSAGAGELRDAVKRVAEGGRYIEREIAEQLALAPVKAEDPLEQLSPRETEILRHLGEGKSLTDIAETLGVAYKTVANTCSSMKAKLGLTRTADLIRISIESRSR